MSSTFSYEIRALYACPALSSEAFTGWELPAATPATWVPCASALGPVDDRYATTLRCPGPGVFPSGSAKKHEFTSTGQSMSPMIWPSPCSP
jgi:hypothetical protein